MDAEACVSCKHCGESVEQPFTCSHCDQQYCSKHRLPEQHDCPLFVAEAAERPTRGQVHADRTQGSGVDAPEPMDLDRSSHRAEEPDASEAERVERLQARRREQEQSVDSSTEHVSRFNLLSLRAGTTVRTGIRALGLLAVLVAVYHLFATMLLVDPPTWAPWRVFGLWVAGEGTLVHLGDLALLVGGAVVAWFV